MPDTTARSLHIQFAARVVNKSYCLEGLDQPPTIQEREECGSLMRRAGVLIRELSDEVKTWQKKALDAGNHPAVKALLAERDEAIRSRDFTRKSLANLLAAVDGSPGAAATADAMNEARSALAVATDQPSITTG